MNLQITELIDYLQKDTNRVVQMLNGSPEEGTLKSFQYTFPIPHYRKDFIRSYSIALRNIQDQRMDHEKRMNVVLVCDKVVSDVSRNGFDGEIRITAYFKSIEQVQTDEKATAS